MNDQSLVVSRFHELHAEGCFVLPNPWDIGSAIYLEHLGFNALATTSAGFAFSRGQPDSVLAVPRDAVLDHCREIVGATSLPVNADFQNGYADEPEGVAANVERCIATGVAGLSIEDASGNSAMPLYDFALAVERIKAARTAIYASKIPVVLTARWGARLVWGSDPLRVALDRLVAFAEAGADCLYAPGVSRPQEIGEIVKAVSPRAVNVLVSKFNCDLTVPQLAELGVRRISVGSALANVAWGAFMNAARNIKDTGAFGDLAGAAAFNEINDLFSRRVKG